jgi:hypothetical protein
VRALSCHSYSCFDHGCTGLDRHSSPNLAHHHHIARADCKYVAVASGDGCASLATKCGISGSDFTKYNPKLDCSKLQIDDVSSFLGVSPVNTDLSLTSGLAAIRARFHPSGPAKIRMALASPFLLSMAHTAVYGRRNMMLPRPRSTSGTRILGAGPTALRFRLARKSA